MESPGRVIVQTVYTLFEMACARVFEARYYLRFRVSFAPAEAPVHRCKQTSALAAGDYEQSWKRQQNRTVRQRWVSLPHRGLIAIQKRQALIFSKRFQKRPQTASLEPL